MTEIQSDVSLGVTCEKTPERLEFDAILKERAKTYKKPKSYPSYAAFCDDPEEKTGFKPARVAQWLAQNEHFKTDRKTEILYYGDENKGKWNQDGDIQLQETCSIILGEENRAHHYTNILHALKGLTYCDMEFSRKIACENGLLNVETGELTPFTLEEMAFYSITATYNPQTTCPHWLEFLKQVLDPEDIPTLQEWSGYLLLPDYRFHKLKWLWGEGRNGKGVWQRTMEGILGENSVAGVGLEEFDGAHRFAMRQLYGKLFNPCSEPTTNRILQTALLKKATGQDTISAECKGKDKRINFRNCAKITVIANKFPKIRDSTTAFKERRLFVKFPNEFIGDNCIPNLEQIWLDSPEEKSGILNWMLEGLQRLLKNNCFTESKSQEEIEIAFDRASDTITAFLKEVAVFNKKLVTIRTDAYDQYKNYCEAFGIDQESNKPFTQRLKEPPKITVTTTESDGKRLRAWQGIGFRKLNDDGSVSDVPDLIGSHPLVYFSKSSKNDTSDTCTCGDCELFHKPSCVFPGMNFDKIPEDSNFALDCRSFTKKEDGEEKNE